MDDIFASKFIELPACSPGFFVKTLHRGPRDVVRVIPRDYFEGQLVHNLPIAVILDPMNNCAVYHVTLFELLRPTRTWVVHDQRKRMVSRHKDS